MFLGQCAFQQFERAMNHIGQAEPGRRDGSRSRVIDDLIDDAVQAMDFPENALKVLAPRIIRSRVIQEESGG